MRIIDTSSLANTLDSVADSFFNGIPIPHTDQQDAAEWIAGRQGLPGSYADMFAPTDNDFADGIRLFTGEKVSSRAGTAHVLGEEACRALLMLDVRFASVRKPLERATTGMLKRLQESPSIGMYCCGTCSVALWRHLSAGGLDNCERRLAAGIRELKSHREGNGRWKRFPFYYSLFALSDIDLPAAVREIRYAAPVLERLLNRSPKEDIYDGRRRALAEKAMASI